MKTKGIAWTNLAALIFVNLLWAAQYPAYQIASRGMESAALNFWALFFAAALLFPFWLLKHKEKKALDILKWKTLREYVVLGIFGIVPPSVILSWGIGPSSASNAAILSLMIPLLMTGLGVLMLKEDVTVLRAGSLALGLIGTLMVSTSDLRHISLSRDLLMGNCAILIATLGSAFYNVYSKNLLSRYSELEVLIFSYIIGILACALISATFETKPLFRVSSYSSATWIAIAFLGFLSWGIAMVLWMWVLNRLDVSQVSVSIYLLPFFGLILSIMAVHDHITVAQVLGGALTVAGTTTLTLFDRDALTKSVEFKPK
jgi:drug/metabolite transporter (DMT)-like permease